MKRGVLYFLLAILAVSAIAIGAEYPSRLGNRDLEWGSGTWVDNQSRTRYRINADIIPFSQDNAIKVGNTNLYNLSVGVIGNWKVPYTNGSGIFATLALDNSGLCLKSGGVASAPVWGPCGTGGGTSGTDNLIVGTGYYLRFGAPTLKYLMYYKSSEDRLMIGPSGYPYGNIEMDNTGKTLFNAAATFTQTRHTSGSLFDNGVGVYFGKASAYDPTEVWGIYSNKFNTTTK